MWHHSSPCRDAVFPAPFDEGASFHLMYVFEISFDVFWNQAPVLAWVYFWICLPCFIYLHICFCSIPRSFGSWHLVHLNSGVVISPATSFATQLFRLFGNFCASMQILGFLFLFYLLLSMNNFTLLIRIGLDLQITCGNIVSVSLHKNRWPAYLIPTIFSFFLQGFFFLFYLKTKPKKHIFFHFT